MDVAFEFFQKIEAPFYAFHDRDIAPEGHSLAEPERKMISPNPGGSRDGLSFSNFSLRRNK
jgi:hypothetical protein